MESAWTFSGEVAKSLHTVAQNEEEHSSDVGRFQDILGGEESTVPTVCIVQTGQRITSHQE